MRALITSDLHLTSRSRDAYRWALFPWLQKQIERRDIGHLFILGDITDQKDRHPSKLLNYILTEFQELAQMVKVWVLMGNHDYVDPRVPFLLRALNGIRNCQFIIEPTWLGIDDQEVLFLPHTRKPAKDWAKINARKATMVLMHHTFSGAMTSNGWKMEEGGSVRKTMERLRIPAAAAFVSGDIHVPQTLGHLTYCGSPYPIRFGDDWKPRVLMFDSGRDDSLVSLPRACAKKTVARIGSIDDLEEAGLTPGDQAKVVIELPRSRFCDWSDLRNEVREWAAENEVILGGIELREKPAKVKRARLGDDITISKRLGHEDQAKEFAKARGLDEEVGVSIVRSLLG